MNKPALVHLHFFSLRFNAGKMIKVFTKKLEDSDGSKNTSALKTINVWDYVMNS